jgi:VWFA-related protein
MSRFLPPIAFAACVGAVALRAQAPAPQEPFRAAVDVIRVDVSVLDKDRRPVRGLTAADFTVLENGNAQRIVAVTEVDARAEDPLPSAWLRLADDPVARNDLADQVGDGQAVVIVMDDDHVPFDDSEMMVAARDVAHYIVGSLAPSDSAAVVFPVRAGNTQDFTRDRTKLTRAIDTFAPQEEDELAERYRTLVQTPYNRVLDLDPCLRNEPLLTTLRAVTERLAAIPNRRKTVLLVSTGSPVQFTLGGTCQDRYYEEMRQTFRLAQRANVNIHGVDPGGFGGMEGVLMRGRIRNGRMEMPANSFDAHQRVKALHEFLELYADQTGGRTVVDSVDVDAGIDEIFTESSSYYLIGYQTANPNADGKYRRVQIKVKGRDVTVRAKAGYWAPDKASATNAANPKHDAPDRMDLNRTGLGTPVRLALRASAQPVAVAADGTMTIAAVLAVRVPAPRTTVTDRLAVVRTVIDLDGESGAPVQQILTRTLEPTSGDDLWYETTGNLALAPGRYEIRFEAHSDVADASGSVYAEVEVPEWRRCAFCASGLVLGQPPDAPAGAGQALPVVPTASRDFVTGGRVVAWLRVFQRSDAAPLAIGVSARIIDAAGAEVVAVEDAIPASAFGAERSGDYRLDLPLSQLVAGPHLLSVTATRPDGRTIRRDVVFRVR